MKSGFRYVSNKTWNKYKKIISAFLDKDSARQGILWAHYPDQPVSFGEDQKPGYILRYIEVLCYYNAFRNWPINRYTTTGELDEENLSIIISTNYLREHRYLNSSGYFDFNWASDRFIINGIVYKPSGDTQISQAKDEAIAFLIILKRDIDNIIDPNPKIINQVRDSDNNPVYKSKNRDIHNVVVSQ